MATRALGCSALVVSPSLLPITVSLSSLSNSEKRHVSLSGSSPNKLAPSSPWPLLLPLAAVGCLSFATGFASAVEAVESSKNVLLLSQEPPNALSLPTWTIHVASVVEWAVAMALVWKYGDNPKYAAWKGLTWGMVPLLGGAMCACTWHFFYNAESLEVLVVLQAALTMIGNFTMWIAAYRIYLSSSKAS